MGKKQRFAKGGKNEKFGGGKIPGKLAFGKEERIQLKKEETRGKALAKMGKITNYQKSNNTSTFGRGTDKNRLDRRT